jgi:hypothetical protein
LTGQLLIHHYPDEKRLGALMGIKLDLNYRKGYFTGYQTDRILRKKYNFSNRKHFYKDIEKTYKPNVIILRHNLQVGVPKQKKIFDSILDKKINIWKILLPSIGNKYRVNVNKSKKTKDIFLRVLETPYLEYLSEQNYMLKQVLKCSC